MITKRRNFSRTVFGIALGFGLWAQASAQTYPDRPVRIVVSFAAGGGVDMMARLLGERLSRQLGQPFVVENRPGASGTIGADVVARSAPDGYTLLAGGNPELTFMPAVNEMLPYKTARDLAPLMLVANAPSVLVVNAASDIRTVAQFMEKARQEKGLPYGTPGRGTPMHLAFELMNQLHGTRLIHVPYKGGGPATADVVGGQSEAAVINAPPLLPHIQAGKLRALAVLQNERSPLLPDVPTLKEATGIDDVRAPAWFALSTRAGVPPEILERLESALVRIVADAEVKGRLAKAGLDVVALPASSMARIIADESAYNVATVKRLGYTVD